MRLVTRVLATLVAATVVHAVPGEAAFPGERGLIAFGREDQIFTILEDGTSDMQITTEGVNKSPSWSPDGERLAWACDDDLCVSDADGSNRETVLSSPDDEQQPEWSPDGKWIVFSRNPPRPPFTSRRDPRIYKVELDDPDNVVQLTTFPSADPEWSPNGKRIIFTRGEFHGGEGIWSIRPDGSGLQKVAAKFSQHAIPDWSPSGDRIVYLGKKRNAWRVVVATLSGRTLWELTPKHCCSYGVAWAPDGRWLVLVRGDQRHLLVARPRGGHRTVIAQDARAPDWQPR